MSALDEHLKKHRRKLIDRETKVIARMAAAYEQTERELKASLRELEKKITAAKANGEEINRSWLTKQNRLRSLLEQIEDQIVRFGGRTAQLVAREQRAAMTIAVEQAKESYRLIAGTGDTLAIGSTLTPRAIENAVGMIGDGSPILDYYAKTLAPAVVEKIKTEVIKGVTLGTDFTTIARRLVAVGGITKTRALTMARTEVNRVRRETTRQIYQENSDVISGWEWCASKSSRTCPACLAMDGTRHKLEDPFPQHMNCRCTMIPILVDVTRPPRTIGEDWFEQQSDEDKEKILGKEAFDAYTRGEVRLKDFVGYRGHKVFGTSVYTRPVADALWGSQGTFAVSRNLSIEYHDDSRGVIEDILGRSLSDEDVGGLIGAFNGSEIIVSTDGETVFFETSSPLAKFHRRMLGRDHLGRVVLRNHHFEKEDDAPEGTGLRMFVKQVLNARRLGVDWISTMGAGDRSTAEAGGLSGYTVWPRYGYNGPISVLERLLFPTMYRDVADLNELHLRKGGKEVWYQIGSGREMYFDLSEDFIGWQVLKNYLRSKRIKVNLD